jgi:hypothetical protein
MHKQPRSPAAPAEQRAEASPGSAAAAPTERAQQIEQVHEALAALRQIEQPRRAWGFSPMTAAAMIEKFAVLKEAEDRLPGITALLLGAAQGDPTCEHRLEAILRCQEPLSETLQ